VGDLIKEQITKGELPDDKKLKDILSKVAEVSLIKQESSTHAAIDSVPQVQLTKSSSTDVIFSDGPAKYQGAWVCTCNNCRNYWEVMDLTSRRTSSIDNYPKCNSSSIEKEKILY